MGGVVRNHDNLQRGRIWWGWPGPGWPSLLLTRSRLHARASHSSVHASVRRSLCTYNFGATTTEYPLLSLTHLGQWPTTKFIGLLAVTKTLMQSSIHGCYKTPLRIISLNSRIMFDVDALKARFQIQFCKAWRARSKFDAALMSGSLKQKTPALCHMQYTRPLNSPGWIFSVPIKLPTTPPNRLQVNCLWLQTLARRIRLQPSRHMLGLSCLNTCRGHGTLGKHSGQGKNISLSWPKVCYCHLNFSHDANEKETSIIFMVKRLQ